MSEWQPIETAPKDGTVIAARLNDGEPVHVKFVQSTPDLRDRPEGYWMRQTWEYGGWHTAVTEGPGHSAGYPISVRPVLWRAAD